MINTKTNEEIDILRAGGNKLARILRELEAMIEPGVTSRAVDERAFELASGDGSGDRPAFLHYQPAGAPRGFPGSVCVSVNDEIVHGIPNEDPCVFQEGDLVKLDFGLIHEGLVTDSATTVAVGAVSNTGRDLMHATKNALDVGVEAAQLGGHIGDIGAAIQAYVAETPYGLVQGLAGHGVGYEVHEEPLVPNENTAGAGDELVVGTVIAIEPMLSTGSTAIDIADDEFTIKTSDGSLSAHFEHMIAITERGTDVLTSLGSRTPRALGAENFTTVRE